MTARYHDIAAEAAAHGLLARGGFATTPGDGLQAVRPGVPTATVVMIGNGGRAMWTAFQAGRREEPSPLDAWTKRVIAPLAARVGARAVYPYDAPPLPFQRWAARAAAVTKSPVGLLIDPEYGLWHALRAALLFSDGVDVPVVAASPSPCATCADKPCLTTCPIGAFTPAGFDYRSCGGHLRSGAGRSCVTGGCKARLACPIGVQHQYEPAQLEFHSRAFSGVRD